MDALEAGGRLVDDQVRIDVDVALQVSIAIAVSRRLRHAEAPDSGRPLHVHARLS